MRTSDDLPEEEFTHDRDNREIPFSPEAEHIWETQPTDDRNPDPLRRPRAPRRAPPRPATEVQSLMEAPPGHDPLPSAEGLNVSRDRVADAVDRLPPREQWVVEAHMWRGMSFADIGRVLGVGKTQVQRIYASALGRLRSELETHGGTHGRD